MKRKKKIIIGSFLFCLLAGFALIVFGNQALVCSTYILQSGSLPKAADGFRIAQISDLHNTEFGKNNGRLLSLLKEAEPDIIVITGDMLDSYRDKRTEIALHFAEEAMKIAPCYYVAGNHEARISSYGEFKKALEERGVIVLENEREVLTFGDESITLIGIDDPLFQIGDAAEITEQKLQALTREDDGYTILLSHRPDLFDVYAASGVDLVFTGHVHGGQFRLPFVGGLYAPNQGLLPEYDSGLYTSGNTDMLVSRGLGNSSFPIRFNNRPEVILVELRY